MWKRNYVSNSFRKPDWMNALITESSIDKLGEDAFESGGWCKSKCKSQAGHASTHCNPLSSNHHQAPLY